MLIADRQHLQKLAAITKDHLLRWVGVSQYKPWPMVTGKPLC